MLQIKPRRRGSDAVSNRVEGISPLLEYLQTQFAIMAKMYTKLSKNAINTEFPTFGTNTNSSTIKVTNYFELEEDNNTFNIFLNKCIFYLTN